ncbi:MAG TPA: ATP-dependent DNA ligase, partial [Flavobacteriales bacterium]|nr:ATP-dependent DNA ligase [Flavobacteriales bacterium]
MKQASALFDVLSATKIPSEQERALIDYFSIAEDTDKLRTIALLTGKRPKRVATTAEIKEWACEMSGITEPLFEE